MVGFTPSQYSLQVSIDGSICLLDDLAGHILYRGIELPVVVSDLSGGTVLRGSEFGQVSQRGGDSKSLERSIRYLDVGKLSLTRIGQASGIARGDSMASPHLAGFRSHSRRLRFDRCDSR